MGNESSHDNYYHYTDRKGKEAIEKSGCIKTGDGLYGRGLYVTSMSPKNGRKKVSQNNWDGGWSQAESNGKADYAFKLKLPKSEVTKADTMRDIYTVDKTVKLSDYKYKIKEKKHKK